MGDSSFEVRDKVAQFATYEDYLESQISEVDMFYLESEEVARQLVELGYRGSGDTLKRDEFEARKKADQEKHLHREAAPKPLASMGKPLADKPFLQALAAREELVRNGKLTCIVFVRDTNAKGQEVSGYIDYAHRLKTENWEPYFEGRAKVLPNLAKVKRSHGDYDEGELEEACMGVHVIGDVVKSRIMTMDAEVDNLKAYIAGAARTSRAGRGSAGAP